MMNKPCDWIDALFRWADAHSIPNFEFIEDYELDENGEFIVGGFWVGLPRSRDELLNLETLNLSWHSLTEIPEQIRYLTKLKRLEFAKHRDGAQPSFYLNMKSDKKITHIPDWISDLQNLEHLDLFGNDISVIPEALAQLPKLKTLYLNDNPICSIPENFGALKSLQQLEISTQQMAFPKVLCALTSLKAHFMV